MGNQTDNRSACFDRDRIETSLNSEINTIPAGLTPEEIDKHLISHAKKVSSFNTERMDQVLSSNKIKLSKGLTREEKRAVLTKGKVRALK